MVDDALKTLDGRFEELYDEDGRKSIPPERLLRALLVQMLYSIRSERMLMEQLEYNLLFRWFVGLSLNEPVWHPTVFTKNRDRLLEGEIAGEFFQAVLKQARRKRLLSNEHFTVDGTLIEAWAGQKSFQLKDEDDLLKPPPPPDPGSKSNRRLPQAEALQRHAPIQDRSVSAPLQEDARRGSQTVLLGSCIDRKPEWLGGEHARDAGHRHRGTGCGDLHG